MPNAIHLINRREGPTLLGLTRWPDHPNSFRSCCWHINDEEAAQLIGGWVYFHETKLASSRLGGMIVGFEPGEGHMADRKIILFQMDNNARGQKWRGANHGMAMWSGLVEASLPHEVAPPGSVI